MKHDTFITDLLSNQDLPDVEKCELISEAFHNDDFTATCSEPIKKKAASFFDAYIFSHLPANESVTISQADLNKIVKAINEVIPDRFEFALFVSDKRDLREFPSFKPYIEMHRSKLASIMVDYSRKIIEDHMDDYLDENG